MLLMEIGRYTNDMLLWW